MAPSAETTARRWQLVLAYQRLGSYVEAAKVCKSRYVAARLAARHDLTEDNYIAAIRKEWEAIPQQVHDNIFNSIRGRLQECIDMGGGNTSY